MSSISSENSLRKLDTSRQHFRKLSVTDVSSVLLQDLSEYKRSGTAEWVLRSKVKYGQRSGRTLCGPEVLKRSATFELARGVEEINCSWFPDTFFSVDR